MKLTWFGQTTIRIHFGGQILVADSQNALGEIDAVELISGADQIFGLEKTNGALPIVDLDQWRPRRAMRLIDQVDAPAVSLCRTGEGAILLDGEDDAPLLLVPETADLQPGRWADGCVIVLFGGAGALGEKAAALLKEARPKLLALAGDEAAIEAVFERLQETGRGVPIMALEQRMALEA